VDTILELVVPLLLLINVTRVLVVADVIEPFAIEIPAAIFPVIVIHRIAVHLLDII
jgi:hypothetical protein